MTHEDCKVCQADTLLDIDFLDAMRENWFDGANRPGRTPNGWKTMEWNGKKKFEYLTKLSGHLLQAENATDPVEARKHWAAVACNANILFHYER